MQTATPPGGGDSSRRRFPYSGFWKWSREMERLDTWPRMDDAFDGRALERSSGEGFARGEGRQQPGYADELEQALQSARSAWLNQRKH